MVEVFFPGSEGKLQGIYEPQNNGRAVLILPPYPKYGGTMNNKVVCALFNAFVKNGFSTLRMNFRGVQKSSGTINNSDNELLKDASAAINWVQDQNPMISEFWIAGFSFGAWMATNLVMRRPEATGFIAVSPPVERYDFSFLSPCLIPGLIIQGDEDSLTDHNEVRKLAEKLMAKIDYIEYHCINGGNYRLSDDNHIKEIEEIAFNFINKTMNSDTSYFNFQEEDQEEKESVFEEVI